MKNTYLWTERHQGSLKFLLNTYINKERLAFCPLCTSLSHHTALELNEPCNLCGWKVLTGKTCGKWSCDELGKTPTDLVLLRFDLNADFLKIRIPMLKTWIYLWERINREPCHEPASIENVVLPPDIRVFVVAGSKSEAEKWATDNNHSKFTYLNHPNKLHSWSYPKYVLTGTWHSNYDSYIIKKELVCRLAVKVNKLFNIISRYRRKNYRTDG